MPHFLKEIGPVLGFISFGLFLALLVLYVLRALEIHRLKRAAPFLAEVNGKPRPPRRRFGRGRIG